MVMLILNVMNDGDDCSSVAGLFVVNSNDLVVGD